MAYLLYRIEQLGASPSDPPLGQFRDFDAALAARDEDLLTQLDHCPAPPREVTHLIVGPGVTGARTEHPIVTFAGAEVDHPGPTVELVETRAWLNRIRGR